MHWIVIYWQYLFCYTRVIHDTLVITIQIHGYWQGHPNVFILNPHLDELISSDPHNYQFRSKMTWLDRILSLAKWHDQYIVKKISIPLCDILVAPHYWHVQNKNNFIMITSLPSGSGILGGSYFTPSPQKSFESVYLLKEILSKLGSWGSITSLSFNCFWQKVPIKYKYSRWISRCDAWYCDIKAT